MNDQPHDDPAPEAGGPGAQPAQPDQAAQPAERPVSEPRRLTRNELETLRERLQKKFH